MVIFIAMTCLICLQVILRFFMGSGFAWGEEFATFMFVWLCFLEPLLIMVIFIAMTCLICLQVILRFFMGSGFAWGEEFATFMFVWLCFPGISYAFRNNRQISVQHAA